MKNRLKEVIEHIKSQGKYRTQTAIAKLIEFEATNLSSAVNGSEKYLTEGLIGRFCEKFPEINKNWFLTGTGSMLNDEPEQSDAKVVDDENEAEIFVNKNDVKFMIYSDDTIKVEVDMMPFRAYASSEIDCYFDKEYRENEFNKAIFSVDKVARGLYLGFKSQNESMNGGGIDDTPSGAELLCRELGKHLWDKLHSSKYGFVLMTKRAIRHKDITNYDRETGMLTLHSRNPEEEDFEESINDVYRIFKVIKRTF